MKLIKYIFENSQLIICRNNINGYHNNAILESRDS